MVKIQRKEEKMTAESINSINQIRKLVDEEPECLKSKFIRAKQGIVIYNMSRPEFLKLAVQAGAAYKIGGMFLVNKEVFEDYLETYRIPGEIK